MKKYLFLPVAALAVATGCEDNPAGLPEATAGSEIVITQGVKAQAPLAPKGPWLSNFATPTFSTVGGSTSNPVALKSNTCTPAGGNTQTIEVVFRVSGQQGGTYTFKVPSSWSYNGVAWSGSNLQTVTVPAQSSSTTSEWPVSITITNNSGVATGTSSFNITPQDVSGSGSPALNLSPSRPATVHVEFVGCAAANTAPTLTLPSDITEEATSSAGRVVTYTATANDAEDGPLTAICSPASGSTFPLGETTVNCSATDSGGLTTQGSFKVTVEDTTAPEFGSFPSGTVTRIATGASGWAFDIASFGITAADVGGVSEPVTISCSPAQGTALAIGTVTTVSCTAEDAAGNESAANTFDVLVTLDFATGYNFTAPLRLDAPYSAHKKGSTVPHKIPAPRYADGSPASDLAGQLRLVLRVVSNGQVESAHTDAESNTPSTAWRYDPTAGQYIFNVATNGLTAGSDYQTTLSIGAVDLGQTVFGIRR